MTYNTCWPNEEITNRTGPDVSQFAITNLKLTDLGLKKCVKHITIKIYFPAIDSCILLPK